MLSESDLPLYDPLTTYAQLLNETKSRVEACCPPAAAEQEGPQQLPQVRAPAHVSLSCNVEEGGAPYDMPS